MKTVFSRTNFPLSKGGNIYQWSEADTAFQVPKKGKYIVAITATAKNAEQNNSKDDDDLRVAIDGYEFGKYEVHDEKVSWKGFGTASSWNGASLKGGMKTVYFFLELQTGEHKVQFYADNTPAIKELSVVSLEEGEPFEIKKMFPAENVDVDIKGIPWMSFIFLGVKPQKFSIGSIVKSASQREKTDGDNLKVLVNGKIVENLKAPTSDKYKNFYFSGDLNQGNSEVLELDSKAFEFLEDSVELWYDETPSLYVNIGLFDSVGGWISKAGKKIQQSYYFSFVTAIAIAFKTIGWKYSSQFLYHSLKENPEKLVFKNEDDLVTKIKGNEAYQKIVSIIRDQIKKEGETGQVHLGDVKDNLDVAFIGGDLEYSLHGVHKIDYDILSKKGNEVKVRFFLFDVYDFSKKGYPLNLSEAFYMFANNQVDAAELAGVVSNFEIVMEIQETLNIKDE